MKTLMVTAIFAAVLGMFQFGFNTGVINSPQDSIQKFINESYFERGQTDLSSQTVILLFSIAVCACLVGGMIGGLSGGYLANRFGRRNALWYSQSLSIAGGIFMGLCKAVGSYEMLLIGRFLIGLACGLFTGLVPLYITEIAPVQIRGGLGTVNQLAVTFGILSSQILSLDVVLGSDSNWPLLLALGAIVPAAIQAVLLPMMPESPRYLILSKRDEALGRQGLEKLRDHGANIEEEIDEIKSSRDEDDDGESMSVFRLLGTKELYLPLFICVTMHLSQQFSGIVAIFYYSTQFFIGAGVPEGSAQYATLGVGAIMVTMTLVTIPLMDRLGRRTLHLTGLAGIFLFSILITILLSAAKPTDDEGTPDGVIGTLIIIATFGFVIFFALGPGSIPWLITGELFEHSPRSAAVSIATVVNWTSNFVVALAFPTMVESLDKFSFLPFAILVAIFFLILWFYLPETKGRTTSEISSLLSGQNQWTRRYRANDEAFNT